MIGAMRDLVTGLGRRATTSVAKIVVLGSAITVLVTTVVAAGAATATAGEFTLTASQSSPATGGSSVLGPGRVRIDGSRWVQPPGGRSSRIEVRYRPRGARSAGGTLGPAYSAVAGQFAVGLIVALDTRADGAYRIAATPATTGLIESWMANEGGLWADNPLNTSLDARRYPHQFTSAGIDTGIPIYPSLRVGIDDTATTLLGNPAYGRILAVLNGRSATCVAFASAVIESPWAAGHYGHDRAAFCSATGVLDVATTAPTARRHPGGINAPPPARPSRAHETHPNRRAPHHRSVRVVPARAPATRTGR
jgi:hypothetical protein